MKGAFVLVVVLSIISLIANLGHTDSYWVKGYGGSGGFGTDEARSISQTSDGGYIIATYKPNGSMYVVVLKLHSNGDVSWSNTYGGNAWDEVETIKSHLSGPSVEVIKLSIQEIFTN